jgi:phenylalanyl-tRNA synthetase alpha subunit
MVAWYKANSKNTGIRWNGKYFPGTRPRFQYMVDYFVKVISRRPSSTRYQWLY